MNEQEDSGRGTDVTSEAMGRRQVVKQGERGGHRCNVEIDGTDEGVG